MDLHRPPIQLERPRQRLSVAEAEQLCKEADALDLAQWAHSAAFKWSGDAVSFHEHRYLRLQPTDSIASITTLLETAAAIMTPTTTEIRLGSVFPERMPFPTLLSILKALREAYPDIVLRGLSASQIESYALHRSEDESAILEALREHGLTRLDGRGAVLSHKHAPRASILPTARWLDIHRKAHKAGLQTEATMLYGLGENLRDRLQFLQELRSIQDDTQGFVRFMALPVPLAEETGDRQAPGMNDLKLLALARLFLDNFPVLSASWGRLSIDLAQLSLWFGANDLEGSITHHRNSRVVGARPFRSMNRNELQSLIAKAGKIPVEHDAPHPPPASRASATESVSRCEQLLYKAEHTGELNREEVLFLAKTATVLQLGSCARSINLRSKTGDRYMFMPEHMAWRLTHSEGLASELPRANPIGYGPRVLAVDTSLVTGQEPLLPLDTVLQRLDVLRKEYPWQVLWVGLKGLWRLARQKGLSLAQILPALRERGVVIITSSPWETEQDLTPSEVVQSHQTIIAAGIVSCSKVEISAPYNGTAEVFWEPFVDRLLAIRDSEMPGFAVSIEKAKDASVSPVEFLKAMALARVVIRRIPYIIAPVGKLPSLQRSGHRFAEDQFNQIKFGPICLHFGANHLGGLGWRANEAKRLHEECVRSGFQPIIPTA